MANVRFESVSKRFDEITAVDAVDLDIHDGEFVCLLGPSGCGKTTTLRLVAGLERVTEGTIRIDDEDVTRTSPKDRDIGMVFQDYALYPHMNLRDNISYPLKVRGTSGRERNERAGKVADSLQIGHLLDRLPGQISGGQQQRTSVARAVVHKPRVFLFDEPLSNLDAKLRLEARAFLKRLQRELGVTAIYVTHDQAEAMALADRIAVMEAGRLIQIGPPLEVYRRPRTTFVADFLGSPPMNLLDVTYEGGTFHRDGFTLDATPWRDALQGRDGQALTLGVRPEHLKLADADTPNAIPGEMYGLEPLGPEALVSMDVNGTLVVVRVFTDDPPDVSGRLHAAFAPEHLHLFASPSGERIA
ncbi:MAG: ABC transporter ATP-binding protein [Trueperaceae bacterium]|nr:ABC transporter ATP-binding protein [Trueperaceae bacterium]